MTKAKLRRRILKNVIIYLVTLSLLIIILFPVFIMFLTAFKPEAETVTFPPTLIPRKATLANFISFLGNIKFSRFILNSLLVTLISTILSMVLSIFAAYSLSRFCFPGRRILSQTVLFAYLFPPVLLIIPLFLLMSRVGLIDSHISLIIVYTSTSLPFCTWMLKGQFDTIPVEVEESARIDGCTRVNLLWKIILPIAKPGLVAAASFSFILAWSEFLFAITFINTEHLRTITAGLYGLITYGSFVKYGILMAGATLAVIPVIIFFFLVHKELISGLTSGAIK